MTGSSEPEAAEPGVSETRVAVADGVALRVLRWTGGTKPPVLCVHGLASNALTWVGVARRLRARGHPVAAVDLRGHGRSDAPANGYDFDTMATDLVAVLDALGWARAVMAGQSTGGNLVVAMGARFPDRVAGVVGVDGGALDIQRRWPVWEDCVSVLAPPRSEGTPAPTMERSLRRAHPDWSDEGVAATMANYEVRDDGTIRPWLTFDRHLRILRALWEHRPATDLARLASPGPSGPLSGMPVLLVMADSGDSGDDLAAGKRADADAAVAALPSAVVRWFSPADHDVHIQHPEALANLISDTFSG